jgi:hypothetical protein
LRHQLGRHERADLEFAQAGLMGTLDPLRLIGGRRRARQDLQPVGRADFAHGHRRAGAEGGRVHGSVTVDIPIGGASGIAVLPSLAMVPLAEPWSVRRFVIRPRTDAALSATTRLLIDHLRLQARAPSDAQPRENGRSSARRST